MAARGSRSCSNSRRRARARRGCATGRPSRASAASFAVTASPSEHRCVARTSPQRTGRRQCPTLPVSDYGRTGAHGQALRPAKRSRSLGMRSPTNVNPTPPAVPRECATCRDDGYSTVISQRAKMALAHVARSSLMERKGGAPSARGRGRCVPVSGRLGGLVAALDVAFEAAVRSVGRRRGHVRGRAFRSLTTHGRSSS